MIKNFKSKETARIFKREFSEKLARDIQRSALRKLLVINSATNIAELQTPSSNRLEKLKGCRRGQFSLRINNQWRICFRWEDGNAYDVEIIDYH